MTICPYLARGVRCKCVDMLHPQRIFILTPPRLPEMPSIIRYEVTRDGERWHLANLRAPGYYREARPAAFDASDSRDSSYLTARKYMERITARGVQ